MKIVLLSIFSTGLLVYSVAKLYRQQNGLMKSFFWPALILKLSGGVALGIIYKYFYTTGDTFGFFSDAQQAAGSIYSAPSAYFNFIFFGDSSRLLTDGLINTQVRSLFLVRILSLVTFISFNNYWIASLYLSTISFLDSS